MSGCHKLGHPSEAAARKARARFGKAQRGHDVRVYRCPHCRKWHLTKQRDGRDHTASKSE